MSKRRADTYLTKEPPRNQPKQDDSQDERDKIDPAQLASEQVMATRKYYLRVCLRVLMVCRLAKPRRSRFANADAPTENVYSLLNCKGNC